jgi:hypothetical protein
MSNIDETILAIHTSRQAEKLALAAAVKRARQIAIADTRPQHEEVLSNVRKAVQLGMSMRQIGTAYGSSDPKTIKRLIDEATLGFVPDETNDEPVNREWTLDLHDDGKFTINAYNWGDQRLSGSGLFMLDPDGVNITQVSGDGWIQIQVYRLGFVEKIVGELHG